MAELGERYSPQMNESQGATPRLNIDPEGYVWCSKCGEMHDPPVCK